MVGQHGSFGLPGGAGGIDNAGQIKSFDLTPLSFCTNLRQIYLGKNQLETIDLNPLGKCFDLEELYLNENQLRTVDLSSLANCTNLQSLKLYMNRLKSIDLTPLASCVELESLGLSYNILQTVDLSPLIHCTKLRDLDLIKNQLQTIDLSPLTSCTNLRSFGLVENQLQTPTSVYSWLPVKMPVGEIYLRNPVYYQPIESASWSFLSKVAVMYGRDWRVQHDILIALGLENYGFVDCDLIDMFLSFSADTPIEIVREHVREELLKQIILTVEQQGATTGLNLEETSGRHREIAVRVPEIIENRRLEIDRLELQSDSRSMVNLQEFCLTAYGYDIIRSMKESLVNKSQITEDDESLLDSLHNLRVSEDLFIIVKQMLGNLELHLEIGTKSSPGVRMSYDLMKCIWWILSNLGESWNYIRYMIDRPAADILLDTIRKMHEEGQVSISEGVLIEIVGGSGITHERAKETIKRLLQEGIIYAPQYGVIRSVL